jgi:hypothetical protein
MPSRYPRFVDLGFSLSDMDGASRRDRLPLSMSRRVSPIHVFPQAESHSRSRKQAGKIYWRHSPSARCGIETVFGDLKVKFAAEHIHQMCQEGL